MHPARLDIEKLLKDCTFTTGRTRGPGGQHRNKVETAVWVTHEPTGCRAHGTESRSQARNKSIATKRLRIRLALYHRGLVPIPGYKPSPLLQSRIQRGKIVVSSKHVDFAAVVSEVLDLLHELQGDVKKASEYLNVTSTQIVKFLKNNRKAFTILNDIRKENNLHPLK